MGKIYYCPGCPKEVYLLWGHQRYHHRNQPTRPGVVNLESVIGAELFDKFLRFNFETTHPATQVCPATGVYVPNFAEVLIMSTAAYEDDNFSEPHTWKITNLTTFKDELQSFTPASDDLIKALTDNFKYVTNCLDCGWHRSPIASPQAEVQRVIRRADSPSPTPEATPPVRHTDNCYSCNHAGGVHSPQCEAEPAGLWGTRSEDIARNSFGEPIIIPIIIERCSVCGEAHSESQLARCMVTNRAIPQPPPAPPIVITRRPALFIAHCAICLQPHATPAEAEVCAESRPGCVCTVDHLCTIHRRPPENEIGLCTRCNHVHNWSPGQTVCPDRGTRNCTCPPPGANLDGYPGGSCTVHGDCTCSEPDGGPVCMVHYYWDRETGELLRRP